ncbi:BCAM0308 family protein [Methylogaea oryzae]|uniref:ATPase n=1 Tax=Methylogaea oryzae TaxID=1295382 RepID=A0A8D4VQ67_9GAMM|nr:BCAM0308 family protein [Methylogaea oryzae]BBL71736.1 hypothetical protein MoryE10_23420 [Methylogaea oryzae]
MTSPTRHSDPSHQPRRDSLYSERVSDPYRARGKWPEPTTCPDCGAIFHNGHWQWGEPRAGAETHACPACERVRDGVPAAEVRVKGAFFAQHRQDILNLIHNAEAKAKAEHALERIMNIAEEGDGVLVTFTGAHLAHGVGQAVHHAYQGELHSVYTDEDGTLRITWSR